MIDRENVVKRHNPVLKEINTESPLTVGNGEFAFTADVTGFQSLYDTYGIFPLCTMSAWGWHTEPADGKYYTQKDLVFTEYNIGGRSLSYPVHPQTGNEDVYHFLRHNPHRLNLARVALLYDGMEIKPQALSAIRQTLNLFSGVLVSEFKVYGKSVRVQTVCAKSADVLGFCIEASAACMRRLSVGLFFPYGSHEKNASNWDTKDKHSSRFTVYSTQSENGVAGQNGGENGGDCVRISRVLDRDRYSLLLRGADSFEQVGRHEFEFRSSAFTLSFFAGERGNESIEIACGDLFRVATNWQMRTTTGWQVRDDVACGGFQRVKLDSENGWRRFWTSGGAVDFSRAKDPRARELERRAILSQYLTAAQCAGSSPPQETGLSCNSWYGKFHLEMHIIHAGWFPLWGHSDLLEKSFSWYKSVLGEACENAAHNGFQGARWPKMVSLEGIDSPSWIAPLLIWQQVHILYMLELACRSKPSDEQFNFMRDNWRLVKATVQFMCSFVSLDKNTKCYNLPPPLIPAQEEHAPEITLNPTFELSYWHFGLEIGIRWAEALSENCGRWKKVSGSLAKLPMSDGLYSAHQNCKDTFTHFNKDHPSMLYAYGFIPCAGVNTVAMSGTADKVLECWERGGMWGWDYALIAMTFMRLGRYEDAIDILLTDDPKNYYTVSGNNFQKGREDLPLYLPGNGSLLFALAMLVAGYGKKGSCLPDNGMWEVEAEGIAPLPY